MRKTTIVLTEDQYFYLQRRVLELKRHVHSASMASVIRGLIDSDRKRRSHKGRSSR